MDEWTLPRRLVETADRDRSPGRRAWIAQLPHAVADLSERWSLRLGAPFQPGGECSWAAPATDPAGRDLVLKVGWWHTEAAHEADALRVWDGDGAVRVHDAHVVDSTSALLLEHCVPGTPLESARPPAERDVVIADLLRRLWREPPAGSPFRPLQDMCDLWADEFEQRSQDEPHGLDPGLARAGIELFRSLPGSAERHVLLCTDLHAGNILAAERQPWLAIDPKPYVGDPVFDPLQHMINESRVAEDPEGLVRRMAMLTDLDPHRLRLWLFARCVQESLDHRDLRGVAAQLAPR